MAIPLLPGRAAYALAIGGFGALCLVFGEFVDALQPMPESLARQRFLAYVTGVILLGTGIGLLVERTARAAAAVAAAMLALWFLLLHLPRFLTEFREPPQWVVAFETLALLGGASILIGMLAPRAFLGDAPAERWQAMTRFGQVLYGVSLPVFGVLHFLHAAFVATLVPAWIPGRLFWAYATGAAFVAAGIAITSGILRRTAGVLTGAMFASWVAVVHSPRVAADAANRAEWTSLFVALGMCGAAWIVAARNGAPPRQTGRDDALVHSGRFAGSTATRGP